MRLDDEMWKAAREKFYGRVNKDCGLADDKYEVIKNLMTNWDTLSAAERREVSGGNQSYWRNKYQMVGDKLCYKAGEEGAADALSVAQVSRFGTMFHYWRRSERVLRPSLRPSRREHPLRAGGKGTRAAPQPHAPLVRPPARAPNSY